MSEVRCADGETLCQARQQPRQCVLELQQIHRDGLHRQPKHPGAVIVVSNADKNVANVKALGTLRMIGTIRTIRKLRTAGTIR